MGYNTLIILIYITVWRDGRVRLIALDSKSSVQVVPVSWVQIPLSPPILRTLTVLLGSFLEEILVENVKRSENII